MYEAHPCTNFHNRSMPIEIFVCMHTKIHFRLHTIIVVDRPLLINQLLMSKIVMKFKLITTFWYTGKYIEVDLPVLHILRTNQFDEYASLCRRVNFNAPFLWLLLSTAGCGEYWFSLIHTILLHFHSRISS